MHLLLGGRDVERVNSKPGVTLNPEWWHEARIYLRVHLLLGGRDVERRGHHGHRDLVAWEHTKEVYPRACGRQGRVKGKPRVKLTLGKGV